MTTPQLNRDEQQRVDRVAELEQHRRNGTKFVSDHELNEAKKIADAARMNAEARAKRQAQLEGERQAKAHEYEAVRQAQIADEVAAYKRRAQAAFPGTSSEFEEQWPASKLSGNDGRHWRRWRPPSERYDRTSEACSRLNQMLSSW